ncbi:hypothetical protein ACB092_07G095100 [Castanea dentata]
MSSFIQICTSLTPLICFLYLPHRVIALTSPLNPVTIINFDSREVLSLNLNHPLIGLKSRVGIGDKYF